MEEDKGLFMEARPLGMKGIHDRVLLYNRVVEFMVDKRIRNIEDVCETDLMALQGFVAELLDIVLDSLPPKENLE